MIDQEIWVDKCIKQNGILTQYFKIIAKRALFSAFIKSQIYEQI